MLESFRIESERLFIRKINLSDAPFILKLLNDENYIKFIRDSGVRTIQDAEAFIKTSYIKSYHENSFGLYLVQLKDTNTSIGICGVLKREWLSLPDIGFAFLTEYCGKGFGYESALTVIKNALKTQSINSFCAITSQDNQGSIALLKKLGFKYIDTINYMNTDAKVSYFEYTT